MRGILGMALCWQLHFLLPCCILAALGTIVLQPGASGAGLIPSSGTLAANNLKPSLRVRRADVANGSSSSSCQPQLIGYRPFHLSAAAVAPTTVDVTSGEYVLTIAQAVDIILFGSCLSKATVGITLERDTCEGGRTAVSRVVAQGDTNARYTIRSTDVDSDKTYYFCAGIKPGPLTHQGNSSFVKVQCPCHAYVCERNDSMEILERPYFQQRQKLTQNCTYTLENMLAYACLTTACS